ncbi:MAG: prepilin-type N-terminal cleavage/methylation domain-containing protein [Patescibacteria group bacterium]
MKKGFTIIELMVVAVIISILATVAVVNFNGAQEKSKDARGIADLEAVAGGLVMFKADNKRYPVGQGYTGTLAHAPYNDFTTYTHAGSGLCAHSSWTPTVSPNDEHFEWTSGPRNLGVALSAYLPSMPKPWEYGRGMRYCSGEWYTSSGRTIANFELLLTGLVATRGNGSESWDPGQRLTTNQIIHY